jgi:hypothetical protein
MKLASLVIVTNAVRRFRKSLSALARSGRAKTRLIGDRKSGYYVGVQRPTSQKVIVVSPRFDYKQQAEAWNDRKHCQNMPVRALALAS